MLGKNEVCIESGELLSLVKFSPNEAYKKREINKENKT